MARNEKSQHPEHQPPTLHPRYREHQRQRNQRHDPGIDRNQQSGPSLGNPEIDRDIAQQADGNKLRRIEHESTTHQHDNRQPLPQGDIAGAERIIKNLIEKHKVDIIAIGNGTASHESEVFMADLLKKIDRKVSYMVVSEAGASVYSASKLAAEEFPEYDVSLRSAVSIARRLQDPLAELVKIDPKAIGVGQYQHDMPPAKL